MRGNVIFLVFIFYFNVNAHAVYQKCKYHAEDVVSTGMPVAFCGLVLWAFFNRVPRKWTTLKGDVAEFIYTTWEQQGFKKARTIALKRIPHDSVFFKVVVFTQELPGVLAVGELFIEKIQILLTQKKDLLNQLSYCNVSSEQQKIKQKLNQVESLLDEFRFVCGHERVHKERHHIYKLLLTQLLAPFAVYAGTKMIQGLLKNHNTYDKLGNLAVHGTVRSALELALGFFYTRKFEYDADRFASSDKYIQEAGLRLFTRCYEQQKTAIKKPKEKLERMLGWALYYTHPTLQERIILLTYMLQKH